MYLQGNINPLDNWHTLPNAVNLPSQTVAPISTNFVGQLSIPNSFYPSALLGLQNNGTPQSAPIMPNAQNVGNYDIFGYPPECLSLGLNCPESTLGTAIATGHDIFKKIGLILLALILLAFGLFLLAESTKTGAAALNVATKL